MILVKNTQSFIFYFLLLILAKINLIANSNTNNFKSGKDKKKKQASKQNRKGVFPVQELTPTSPPLPYSSSRGRHFRFRVPLREQLFVLSFHVSQNSHNHNDVFLNFLLSFHYLQTVTLHIPRVSNTLPQRSQKYLPT